jgi:hypothetical protein
MPKIKSVLASSARFEWIWPIGTSINCLNPCCEARLLDVDMETNWTKRRWNAGRYAPVTLRLELDAPAAGLEICPDMEPESGQVSLASVIVDEDTGQRCAHIGQWHDAEWVSFALPTTGTQCLLIEFVSSPSWIAVRAMRFTCLPLHAKRDF